jgi:hypothetical protein
MFGIGIPELQVAFVLILLAALVEWWRLRHAGPNLVLREFRVGTAETAGEFLYILGRRSGLVAWLLTLFGLQAQTSFSVTDDEVARETVGPRGFEYLYSPLTEISSSRCSYYRAFLVLVLSLAFFAYGLITLLSAVLRENDYVRQRALAGASDTLWPCLILGTACYIWYAQSKRVLISVVARGDVGMGISFKRSVIENVGIELKKAIEAVDLMNARILAKHPRPDRRGD